MSAGKKRGKGKPSKPSRRKEPSPTGSRNWGEHVERAKAAVSFRTGQFMGEHRDRIMATDAEDAAKNSYLSGMLDMLSAARNVLGFWGADQVVMELERSNRASRDRARDLLRSGADGPAGEGPDPRVAETCGPGRGASRGPGKTAKALLRDPMFA